MKIFLNLVFMYSSFLYASDKEVLFNKIEENITTKSLIPILLKPYGKIEDFTVYDESKVSEKCVNKTVIRGNVKCHKTETVKEPLYFAEGNGMLCKIGDPYGSIKCLPLK